MGDIAAPEASARNVPPGIRLAADRLPELRVCRYQLGMSNSDRDAAVFVWSSGVCARACIRLAAPSCASFVMFRFHSCAKWPGKAQAEFGAGNAYAATEGLQLRPVSLKHVSPAGPSGLQGQRGSVFIETQTVNTGRKTNSEERRVGVQSGPHPRAPTSAPPPEM